MIHVEKSQHIFADNAAIQEKAGFVMIVPLTINVEKIYYCLQSTPRELECADTRDGIKRGIITYKLFFRYGVINDKF